MSAPDPLKDKDAEKVIKFSWKDLLWFLVILYLLIRFIKWAWTS